MKLFSIQETATEIGKSRSFVQNLVSNEWKGKCQHIGGGKDRVGFWLIPSHLIGEWRETRKRLEIERYGEEE